MINLSSDLLSFLFDYLLYPDLYNLLLCNKFLSSCRKYVIGENISSILDVQIFRKIFPNSKKLKLSPKIKNEFDPKLLSNLHTLDISFCRYIITDEHFQYLSGIKKLNMSGCNQKSITDKAFSHLPGIHTLNICYCNQATITDKAFSYLSGIHTLHIRGCNQYTITDKAFSYLSDIYSQCNRDTPAEGCALVSSALHTLDMSWCDQPTITNDALKFLSNIPTLEMWGCNIEREK